MRRLVPVLALMVLSSIVWDAHAARRGCRPGGGGSTAILVVRPHCATPRPTCFVRMTATPAPVSRMRPGSLWIVGPDDEKMQP
jgi:hypothetical protein